MKKSNRIHDVVMFLHRDSRIEALETILNEGKFYTAVKLFDPYEKDEFIEHFEYVSGSYVQLPDKKRFIFRLI